MYQKLKPLALGPQFPVAFSSHNPIFGIANGLVQYRANDLCKAFLCIYPWPKGLIPGLQVYKPNSWQQLYGQTAD